ncbi:MAG TPA: hypothetical protein VL306_00190, partial [Methylomirabilota bacterium]|nr:hypothetical protein [Methylomirabilota bacterium]
MPPKVIKLGKKDDIASIVKQIKNLRDKEVIFEMDKGSAMLKSSESLKLMKRTGEVLGKKIQVITDDEIGRVLAKKAGILATDVEVKMPNISRVARSDVKPRFSDILMPRQVINKVVQHTQKVFEPANPSPRSYSPSPKASPNIPQSSRPRFSSRTKLWAGILAGVLIILIGGVIWLPSATITVFARSEPVVRDLEITVDQNSAKVDLGKLTVPGILVTREVSQTKNFPTTGTGAGGNKAQGSVMIYNNTSFTLTLKAATTTLDLNGFKYKFTKDFPGIKPGGVANGPIDITAVDGGSASNAPANSKFKIINQALGNQNVYAINPAPIAGGIDSTQKSVSQKDLDDAVASLTQDIVMQAQEDLSQEKNAPYKLIDSGVTKEVLAHTANKNVGDIAANFDMTLIAKVTGLAFNENDVIMLIESKINQVLSTDKYLVEGADRKYTATYKTVDLTTGQGVLTTHFETLVAYKIDSTNLAKILAGKKESEIKEILLSKPEVD